MEEVITIYEKAVWQVDCVHTLEGQVGRWKSQSLLVFALQKEQPVTV